MDHHVPRAITNGLRLRGVDVITAAEDGAGELGDPALLERATDLDRVLFTQDDDLLTEATNRQRQGQTFTGVIYAHHICASIGGLPSRTCEGILYATCEKLCQRRRCRPVLFSRSNEATRVTA